jgi:hypothetical protein
MKLNINKNIIKDIVNEKYEDIKKVANLIVFVINLFIFL